MKPTTQQQQWLQDYLYQVLTYRETYEEVYDHILTALENKPEARFFETTVSEIIEEDFGGSSALVEMEANSRDGIVKDVIKRYWRYFDRFLKLPELIILVGISVAIFYTTRYNWVGFTAVYFMYLVFLPVLLISIHSFKTGFTLGIIKKSYKDGVFRKIVFKPIVYLYIFNVLKTAILGMLLSILHFFSFAKSDLYNIPNNCVSIFILTALTIHTLSYFKLYKHELKINITVK